jgi:hypothetical protein
VVPTPVVRGVGHGNCWRCSRAGSSVAPALPARRGPDDTNRSVPGTGPHPHHINCRRAVADRFRHGVLITTVRTLRAAHPRLHARRLVAELAHEPVDRRRPRQVQLGPRRPLRQRNVDAILAPFVVGMVDVVILAHWFPDVRSPTHAQAGRSGSGDSLTLLDRPETFGRL